jgi:hypothetical protein
MRCGICWQKWRQIVISEARYSRYTLYEMTPNLVFQPGLYRVFWQMVLKSARIVAYVRDNSANFTRLDLKCAQIAHTHGKICRKTRLVDRVDLQMGFEPPRHPSNFDPIQRWQNSSLPPSPSRDSNPHPPAYRTSSKIRWSEQTLNISNDDKISRLANEIQTPVLPLTKPFNHSGDPRQTLFKSNANHFSTTYPLLIRISSTNSYKVTFSTMSLRPCIVM